MKFVHLFELVVGAALVAIDFILHADISRTDWHRAHQVHVYGIDGGGGAGKDISWCHIGVVCGGEFGLWVSEMSYESALRPDTVVAQICGRGNSGMRIATVIITPV
jgi:hypothetical protein